MIRSLLLLVPAVYAVYYFNIHAQVQDVATPVILPLVNQLVRYFQSEEISISTPATIADTSVNSEVKPFTRHIVAVGDLHGDFPNALRVLQFSGVVDEKGDWTGDADFFVQTGDIIDRGDDTIKLFAWMDQLRAQATSTGGVVLSHLGNHEWMNAIGDWRYVYPTELKTFGSVQARQKMLSSGVIGSTWAANYTVASRLPLHPSLGPPNTPYPPQHSLHLEKDSSEFGSDQDRLEDYETSHLKEHELETGALSHSAISFVHGGLSPTYPNLQPFPTKINELGTSLLRKLQRREQPPPHPPNPYPGLPPDSTREEHLLYDANGPLWYRGWALDDEEKACKDVDEVLKKTGTRRMVMGHTPNFHNIVSRCDGKIIIIDTGISHAYGDSENLENVGKKQRWTEREVISAIYPDRQEIIADDEREVIGDFRGH
ncbi:Metallo-dependent phosphatase [Dendrothele bispora CBS 962.96]|uniref:Metallo-dependent phosphatase n=1 Tax=Dendrothele bispora (strain CBS 962.96) TaxID=1314807 RepID=A0A4S8MX72_DENBC|nr:Metallo-dependent phosphatase [Dendrothele bispora CBS 962.96]